MLSPRELAEAVLGWGGGALGKLCRGGEIGKLCEREAERREAHCSDHLWRCINDVS